MSGGFVYFIEEEETGCIKIGFSEKHPHGRLKDFQTGNSNKLRLIGFIEGSYEDESNLHKEFYEERIRNENEWFKPSIRLKKRIKELLTKSLQEKGKEIDSFLNQEECEVEYKDTNDNYEKNGVLFGRDENSEWGWFNEGNEETDGKYVGEIRNSLPHGQGTLTHPFGPKIEGEWKDGNWDGQGTITSPDGRKYVGEFKVDNPWNVKGYDKKGNMIERWINGEKIK